MTRITSSIFMLLNFLLATSFVSAQGCAWADSCEKTLSRVRRNRQRKCDKDYGRCDEAAEEGKNWRDFRPATFRLCIDWFYECDEDVFSWYDDKFAEMVAAGSCCAYNGP